MAKTIRFGKLITLFNQFLESGSSSFESFLISGDQPYAKVVENGFEFDEAALKNVNASKAATVNFADKFEKQAAKYKEVIDFLYHNYDSILSEDDQKRTSALVRGIVEHFEVAHVKLGFSKATVNGIAKTFELSDDTAKLNKTHPKTTFAAKKVVPSVLVGGGLAAAITAGISRLAPGVFLTGHLTDFATLGLIFAAGTAILATATYKIIDYATKKHYERKYGIKASSLEEILENENLDVTSLSVENIENLNLGIAKLLKVVDKRDEMIAKHPKSIFNYVRSKQNRNALHAVAKFAAILSTQSQDIVFDTTRLGELQAKKNLTKKEKNELEALRAEKAQVDAQAARLDAIKTLITTWCQQKLVESHEKALAKKIQKDSNKLGKIAYEDILIAILKENLPKGKKFNGKVKKNIDKDKRQGERLILRMVSEHNAISTLGGGDDSFDTDSQRLGKHYKTTKPTSASHKEIKKLAKGEVKEEKATQAKDAADAKKARIEELRNYREGLQDKSIAKLEKEKKKLATEDKDKLAIVENLISVKQAEKDKAQRENAKKAREQEKADAKTIHEQAKADAKRVHTQAKNEELELKKFRAKLEKSEIRDIQAETKKLEGADKSADFEAKLAIAKEVLRQKQSELIKLTPEQIKNAQNEGSFLPAKRTAKQETESQETKDQSQTEANETKASEKKLGIRERFVKLFKRDKKEEKESTPALESQSNAQTATEQVKTDVQPAQPAEKASKQEAQAEQPKAQEKPAETEAKPKGNPVPREIPIDQMDEKQLLAKRARVKSSQKRTAEAKQLIIDQINARLEELRTQAELERQQAAAAEQEQAAKAESESEQTAAIETEKPKRPRAKRQLVSTETANQAQEAEGLDAEDLEALNNGTSID